jgi:LysM repeat protein
MKNGRANAGCVSQPQKRAPVSVSNTKEADVPSGFYVIQPGDTGVKIAAKHSLTIADLVAMNPEVQWAKLRVGQLVRIAK